MSHTWTDVELMSLPDNGHKVELVNGSLCMSPAGFEHGDIAVAITSAMRPYVMQRRLGRVLESSTGYRLKSSNIRSPDVSFVSAMRLKGLATLPTGFFPGSPDLAVEILSPGDTFDEVLQRFQDYFDNETLLGWIVHPASRTAYIIRPSGIVGTLHLKDSLSGEEVIPGFLLPLTEIFVDFNP